MLFSDAVIYRPNEEMESIFLEFAYGCTHGACIFCHYESEHTPVMLLPDEQIEARLAELSSIYRAKENMFLLGGNILAYKSDYLLNLFSKIKLYIPTIRKISMYARAGDILRKSDPDLIALKAAGMDTLYIGLESGDDSTLTFCNKGLSASEMLTAFNKLDSLSVPYCLTSILGLGGRERWREHAIHTGRLYSKCSPKTITTRTLQPLEGTTIYKMIENNAFIMPTLKEILDEEILMLENMDMANPCLYRGNHLVDRTSTVGTLPGNKKEMLRLLNEYRNSL